MLSIIETMNEIWGMEIEQLITEMTLDEKIGMVHGAGLFRTEGISRLGIPPLTMSDGPMGVRCDFEDAAWKTINQSYDYVTYLPSNSALAASWNTEMADKLGQVLGEEARAREKDVILAPGINIKRSPLNGRNFEYMSEDPYLTEEMTVPLIQGIQSCDTAACVKHFAANGQETERLYVDTIVDERTLNEIYYPGFKAAVQKAGTYSLMGAYNLLNGEHCCHSNKLLNQLLRQEWNYDGTVISDWGGVHDTVQAAESGLDIEMSVTDNFSEYYMAEPLKQAILDNRIKVELLDEKVRNILRMMYRIKKIGSEADQRKAGSYNTPEHRDSCLQLARESVILLKNEEKTLPISTNKCKKIALIGQNAERIHSNGGGSAEIKALYELSPLMGLHMRMGGNSEIIYAPGYYVPTSAENGEVNWQESSLYEKSKELDESEQQKAKEKAAVVAEEIRIRAEMLKQEAIQLAKQCDKVIFIGGLDHDFDVEGKDRQDMKLPYGQDELIEALLEVNKDIVVVIAAGAPVEMPWADRAKAIVWHWYAGMEGGLALADVLLGNTNPSGRLPETLPIKLSDTPVMKLGEFGKTDSVEYLDGVFVGYRYYETEKAEVRFPFGHGLSYSEYSYSNLKTDVDTIKDIDMIKDTKILTVSVDVTNTGNVAGKEVVQLYVAPTTVSISRPVRELRGFKKMDLQPGETKTVSFELEKRAFAYWDSKNHDWCVDAGKYQIQIGKSSRDIVLTTEIEVELTI